MMTMLIVIIFYTVLFVGIEAVSKLTKIDREITRKTAHIVAGTTAAFLPLVMSFQQVTYIGLIFLVVMSISKRANIFSAIHQVKRSTLGEVYFPAAIAITATLFPHDVLYIYGVLVMGISDGLASVLGQRYGKRKFSLFGSSKSYVGSLTFFITAWLIGIGVFSAFGGAPGLVVIIGAVLAAILTVVEASLSFGIDNLVIPPLAAGLLLLIIGGN